MSSSEIQPGLLRRMTVRRILESLQECGPLSRADLVRRTGISAPTVSKAVGELLENGLLEEGAAPGNVVGRPGKKIRLATSGAQVIGLVLDATECEAVRASLDGRIFEESRVRFATPASYDELMRRCVDAVRSLQDAEEVVTLGVGISVPGLVSESRQECLLSPNLQITNHRSPAADLAQAVGLEATCMQETRGLGLAERFYGEARGLDDFAMLDITSGLGVAVVSRGELLIGPDGFAGELGHITVDPQGLLCGCGNRGCLETLATDVALATAVSRKQGQTFTVTDTIRGFRSGTISSPAELNHVLEYLSVAMAAVVNLFNPTHLFVHGRLLDIDESILGRLKSMARARTLAPAFEACQFYRAACTKSQGAVAAIVHHLTRAMGPRVAE